MKVKVKLKTVDYDLVNFLNSFLSKEMCNEIQLEHITSGIIYLTINPLIENYKVIIARIKECFKNQKNFHYTFLLEFEKIQVLYWYGQEFPEIGIKHSEEFAYSLQNRDCIINLIISRGYNVMIQRHDPYMTIWISDSDFKVR